MRKAIAAYCLLLSHGIYFALLLLVCLGGHGAFPRDLQEGLRQARPGVLHEVQEGRSRYNGVSRFAKICVFVLLR